MKDAFAADAASLGGSDGIRQILETVCEATQMGFVAIARVTEDRWIACQVIDKLEFGLEAGGELAIKTTICDEIRASGRQVIIDHVAGDPDWRTHHTPILYGFESYVSLPIFIRDGSFFGTLCAIDPQPRQLSGPATVALLQSCAARVADILSERICLPFAKSMTIPG